MLLGVCGKQSKLVLYRAQVILNVGIGNSPLTHDFGIYTEGDALRNVLHRRYLSL